MVEGLAAWNIPLPEVAQSHCIYYTGFLQVYAYAHSLNVFEFNLIRRLCHPQVHLSGRKLNV